jgi:hypothetical protein
MGATRFRILASDLRAVTRRAVILARGSQREVAGVLVSHGGVLALVELKNVSRRFTVILRSAWLTSRPPLGPHNRSAAPSLVRGTPTSSPKVAPVQAT